MKKSLLLLSLIAFIKPLSAATAVQAIVGEQSLSWIYDNIVLIGIGLLLLAVLLSLYFAVNRVIISQTHDYLREHGIAVDDQPKASPNIFQNLYDRMWALVPVDKEEEINLNHDYDGIEELDNRLPPWWVYLFYITILWAVGYVYVNHFSDIGKSQIEEYEMAMEEAEDAKAAYLATQGNAVDESNVEALTDASGLSSGESIFKANCSACHGQLGEGGVGPNLTDPYWVHGGGIKNVFKTIKYGVPEKGMIAWKAQLPPTAMQQVASYILTLEGTNPPNGKEPEGSIWNAGEEVLKAEVQ